MKAIQASDMILYDRLVNKEILDFAKPHTKFFYCGKDPNKHSLPQEETNRMLIYEKGHTITRLKVSILSFWTVAKKQKYYRIIKFHLKLFLGLHQELQLLLMQEFCYSQRL